ncbi:MAG: hypothetical protein M3R25_13060, partial [Bacteroidota bacterium]|nr:hypothetical protein [Bacteroidota bacterium]
MQKTVDHTVNLWTEEKFKDFSVDSEINSVVVSDSIVLWTNDIGIGSFLKMVITVHQLLYQTMHFGIPLRGAISAG